LVAVTEQVPVPLVITSLPALPPVVGMLQAVPVASYDVAPVPVPPDDVSVMTSPKVPVAWEVIVSAAWVALATVTDFADDVREL
jgi:hypothetical protein